MSSRRAVLGALGLAAAAAVAFFVPRDDSDSARLVLPALESDDLAALSAQSGVPLEDLWARASAMGVGAAVLRPQSRNLAPVAAAGGLALADAPAAGFWGSVSVRGRALRPASWRVQGQQAALLRLALSAPRRLLILRLDPSLGLEGNFSAARQALRALSQRHVAMSLAASGSSPARPARWLLGLAMAAVWLLGVLGPLFAARGGLLVLRRLRPLSERWPLACPALQIAGALATIAAFAAVAGLLIHALGGSLAPLSPCWATCSLLGPLLIAVLTLYTIDLKAWAAALRRPVTYAALLKLAGLALGAALLLAPRWALRGLGAWDGLEALGAAAPVAAWWWPWRWREALVGVPALVTALWLINRRLECPGCAELPAADDPRHWFMLGLLAPIGVTVAVGRGAAPEMLALTHSGVAWLAGAALGAALVLLGPKGLLTSPKVPVQR